MTIEREIKYSRQDRDYACYVNGQYIGSCANYSDGEALCDQVAYDLLMDGQCTTATELDGGSNAEAMAADHAVVAPACATCGGEGRCPDCDPITPARQMHIRTFTGSDDRDMTKAIQEAELSAESLVSCLRRNELISVTAQSFVDRIGEGLYAGHTCFHIITVVYEALSR